MHSADTQRKLPEPKKCPMSFETLVQQTFAEFQKILQDGASPLEKRFHQLQKMALVARMEMLRLRLLSQMPPVVQTGPFAGMHYHPRQIEGCYTPKLLGCYEMELHPVLLDLAQRNQYDRIINIGCGDGYYAVGLARLFPQTPVYAFDTNPKAQAWCQKLAEMNGVSERIHIAGELKPEAFGDWIAPAETTLVFCDIEGAEFALLGAEAHRALLKNADCIIEFHHHLINQPTLFNQVPGWFEDTHRFQQINHAERNPHLYPCLAAFSHLDKWLCCCEYRPCPTPWGVYLRKG